MSKNAETTNIFVYSPLSGMGKTPISLFLTNAFALYRDAQLADLAAGKIAEVDPAVAGGIAYLDVDTENQQLTGTHILARRPAIRRPFLHYSRDSWAGADQSAISLVACDTSREPKNGVLKNMNGRADLVLIPLMATEKAWSEAGRGAIDFVQGAGLNYAVILNHHHHGDIDRMTVRLSERGVADDRVFNLPNLPAIDQIIGASLMPQDALIADRGPWYQVRDQFETLRKECSAWLAN